MEFSKSYFRFINESGAWLKKYLLSFVIIRFFFIFVVIHHQPSTSKTVMPSVSQAMLSLDPTHWMNRCIFECKICSLRFDARANFKGHIQGEFDFVCLKINIQ